MQLTPQYSHNSGVWSPLPERPEVLYTSAKQCYWSILIIYGLVPKHLLLRLVPLMIFPHIDVFLFCCNGPAN